MKKHDSEFLKIHAPAKRIVNLKELGRRLGYVVAMYPNGKAGAMAAAGISDDTLHRYLTGDSLRMPITNLAAICKPHNINLMWLAYGDTYSQFQKEKSKPSELRAPRLALTVKGYKITT